MNVQNVRLADILLIGPFLIYAGRKKQLTKTEKTVLVLFGIGTIIYNGDRFLRNQQ